MLLPWLCRVLLLLLVGLGAGPALAELDETYEGLLVPNNFEMSIPITVQLKEQSGRLSGSVTTGAPYHVTAPISSGENVYGQCNVKIVLTPTFTLRLSGSCQTNMFEGRYTVYSGREDSKPKGTFRLKRKDVRPDEAEKAARNRAIAASSGSVTQCINSNTRCLLACPQGDYNAEFLCSNRCRRKYQTCKAKFSTTPPLYSPGRAPLPDAAAFGDSSR